MYLYLYNYENGKVKEILAWNPGKPQWWITGFNPSELVNEIDFKKQVLIGNVTFATKDMYTSFVGETERNNKVKDFIICDEDKLTVWIIWYSKGVA